MHFRFTASVIGFVVAVLSSGCADDPSPRFSDSGIDTGLSALDASVDVMHSTHLDVPDTDSRGMACTRSAQCDDGVDCTMDYCAADGRCVNLPDTSRCDDSVYCNGLETCDARRGCVRGTTVTCDDNDPCTTDRCDETTRQCERSPRDFDRDGDPDIGCQSPACADAGVVDAGPPAADGGAESAVCWRGLDCDDRDPRVSGRLAETCGDGIDNNCNGFIDSMEPGGCQRPRHDTCDDPLDISAGGSFTVSLAGATGDYNFRCAGGTQRRDVVTRLSLDAPRDIALTARARSGFNIVYVMVQDRCGTTTQSEVRECLVGFPTVWRAHSLPAGEYFVVLGMSGSSTDGDQVQLDVNLTAPTPVATNDRCESPVEIPAGGGSFHGDLIGATDDATTRCGGSSPDVFYRLTLTETRDLHATVTGAMRTDTVSVSLIDQCSRTPTTLRCGPTSGPSFIARSLPAGTYFLAVEGRDVTGYTLTVETAAPTAPPPGDTCMSPLTLGLSETAHGDLTGFESDVPVQCNSGVARDVVYRFELTERRDVTLTATGTSGAFIYLALTPRCETPSAGLVCRAGSPARLTQRGLDPGSYYVVLRATAPTTYTLAIQTSTPLAPVEVTSNDTCSTAQAITAGGGLFSGDTTSLTHDYTFPCATGSMAGDAVFRYHADRTARVTFSTEGSGFDTVLWVTRADTCPGAAPAGATACNDDGPGIGLSSLLDLSLTEGDYFVFVSGLYSTARGRYFLSVTPATSP